MSVKVTTLEIMCVLSLDVQDNQLVKLLDLMLVFLSDQ